jgi:hypothetical protein
VAGVGVRLVGSAMIGAGRLSGIRRFGLNDGSWRLIGKSAASTGVEGMVRCEIFGTGSGFRGAAVIF